MWKPRDVVPEHRRRAWIVWVALLLAITGYAIWEIVVLNDKYKNPSTSTTVKDEYFQFPFVTVCMGLGAGCSTWSNCVGTAFGLSGVYFENDDGSSGTGDAPAVLVESKHSGCIGFDLSQHTAKGFETAVIDMVWEVSGGSPTTDTPNDSTGNDSSNNSSSISKYFEHVCVFLYEKEPDALHEKTYLTMPYQPITSATVETTNSWLTIGKTVKTALSGDVEASFPALTLSQSKYKTGIFDLPLEDGVDYGHIYLSVRQGPFAYTTITELDPLEFGTFLGNLGGFWELLIIVWGVCFVIQRQERGPALTGRNFRIPSFKTGTTRGQATFTPDGEERPHWDTGVQAGESQHEPAHFPHPTGASGHAVNQGSGNSTGDALPSPKTGQPRRHSAAGANNSSNSAGAAATGFGRSFFRPSFRQHRNKSRGSLDNTDYAATKKAASFRRTVELENPVRTGSGAHQIRGEL
eukprot:g20586.t1